MKPIIYQLLVRTFANFNPSRVPNGDYALNGTGTFNNISDKALAGIKALGTTHVWYTGVIRHASTEDNSVGVVKGKAGSPYAITDYYDVDPLLAVDPTKRMKEFEALVKRTHNAGLKVVLDFVPNHVAREYHSLCKPKTIEDLGAKDHPEWAFSPLNDFYYIPNEAFQPTFDCKGYKECPAKATGNDCFHAHPGVNDWYDTIKLNYGVYYNGENRECYFDPRPKLWDKMLHILLFWCKKGIDAFRCDMVGMVPVEFWAWVIEAVHKKYPHVVFIGELYEPHRYRTFIKAGFEYLYDKVGMYEYMRGMVSKNYSADGIMAQWMSLDDDTRQHMLYFLENHDEQRIASGFFAGSGGCAEPAIIILGTLGTNPLLIYSGQEFGEKGMDSEGFSGIDGRSSIFDYGAVGTIQAWANKGLWDGKKLSLEQRKLQRCYQALGQVIQQSSAIADGMLYDLQYAQTDARYNHHEQFTFLRKDDKELVLVMVNFDDKPVTCTITIPDEALKYVGIEPHQVVFTDLLRGATIPSDLHSLTITLTPWTGAILRIEN